LNKKEKKTALEAAKAMGLGVCGVDMIQSKRGPLVMEVNSSPGLEGIEKSTNINIAQKIMEYIAKNVKPKREDEKRKIKKDKIGA
jgi:ribosomal protein S6--L-glutamate ligase